LNDTSKELVIFYFFLNKEWHHPSSYKPVMWGSIRVNHKF